MSRLFIPFAALALLFCLEFLPAQGLPCPSHGLNLARNGDILTLRWDAGTGQTQLVWAPTLADDDSAWQVVPDPVLTPADEWEAEFTMTPAEAYFRVVPAVPPVAPPNVLLRVRNGNLVLEWDSTCDASGYIVYVGDHPGVGPGDHLTSLQVNLTNCVQVEGLTTGARYYVTIVATNFAGTSPPAPVLDAVFGPQGVANGRAVRQFTLGDGTLFEVEAAGAVVSLQDVTDPAAPPFVGTADETGYFRIPGVPEGSYEISYQFAGSAGLNPDPAEVTAAGFHLPVLPVLVGPQPPVPAATLLGRVTLSNGNPARIDVPELGISERATVFLELGSGTTLQAAPDSKGAFAFTGVPDEYPLLLRADYQGLTTTRQVEQPVELAALELRFAEVLPRVVKLTAMQGGAEVTEIESGVPFTVSALVENPDALTLKPFWVAEFNGEKQTSTDATPSFTFHQPPGPLEAPLGDALDSGRVKIHYNPSCLSDLALADLAYPVIDFSTTPPCWSGMAGIWDPDAPDDILSGHPATVTLERSLGPSPLITNTSLFNGYFELASFTKRGKPFLLRIDKPGHMRFLWPFDHGLPLEKQYCLVPADSSTHVQDGVSPVVINHPTGASLTLPPNSVKTVTGANYLGTVVVEMAVIDPLTRHPFPPDIRLRDGSEHAWIGAYSAVWFQLLTPSGAVLRTTPAATLVLPLPASVSLAQVPSFHQDEGDGYFKRWGYGTPAAANRLSAGLYEIPLGTEGLFLAGFDFDILIDVIYQADRSLNYPFDVLVNKSIFPVTVQGFGRNSMGRLLMAAAWGVNTRVLDLRQAPGLHYDDLSNPLLPLPALQKHVIFEKAENLVVSGSTPPGIYTKVFPLSLANSEPNLKSNPSDTTVVSIATPTNFLSRGNANTPAEAAEYYQRIKAPPTLTAWRALNGLPDRFGGTLTGVPPNDYATTYYYNLGDLGFARAQTMRIRTSPVDGQPDVAFAVTNYETLEDARCGRGAVATVCMDHAARADLHRTKKTRYTRFYVYGSDNQLLDCADLDGAGRKYVPNLCVQCHGGEYFTSGGPTDLGSAYLPFDLEAYSFHPKFGVQKNELAKMNAGVLKTDPPAAIQEVIEGWYGNPNPIANLLAFNDGFVPTSWSTDPGLYQDVFKGSCRVCHISREGTSFQFDSFKSFKLMGYGAGSTCSALQMPHAQRTWGILWGSRCAVNLGASIPDAPTILGTAAGSHCR